MGKFACGSHCPDENEHERFSKEISLGWDLIEDPTDIQFVEGSDRNNSLIGSLMSIQHSVPRQYGEVAAYHIYRAMLEMQKGNGQ